MVFSGIPVKIKSLSRPVRILIYFLAGALVLWLFMFIAVPGKLFTDPYSTLMYSREGELLGARIAPDGQWRFPPAKTVPNKFAKCLIAFEDKRFYWHPGVDPAAIIRAVKQNTKAEGVVSGGSTITMQLARLARGNRDRNIYEKLVETSWAVFFETKYSKKKILSLYASHAPFGGNVVGLETAAWRYFGRSAENLSWAESATLAVLPNSPALIHPGRNRNTLKKKRDNLLLKLHKKGVIDEMEYELSCMEPLPDAPVPLPNEAPHLLERLAARSPGTRIESALQNNLQKQVQEIVNNYARKNASNYIHNMAAIVADVETGEVLAYVGNVSFEADEKHGNSVDIITSQRSTGSILKPFLYSGMLNDGLLLPTTLVSDTPLNINGFTPQNYNKTFYGAVPAHRAIERSLNVPLVRMLSRYNTGRFMSLLKSLGMTTLRFSEDHYGSSIILGGAEGTLWDIAGMYASTARMLNPYNWPCDQWDIFPLTPYITNNKQPNKSTSDAHLLSAASLWFMAESMSELNRPEEEAEWQQFSSMKKIAWKTGTSYGGRDAWAVGFTPDYVVGVWAGNASGEGRPGLTGVGTAGPVLFDIFSLLPSGDWFERPYDELEKMTICRYSGHKASDICEPVDTMYMPISGNGTELCSYHRLVHLSQDEKYRVNSSCESVGQMVTKTWFVLPPSQEYYYRNYHHEYVPLPPFRAGCESAQAKQIDIIYPEHNAVLFLPKGFTGEYEMFIFHAAHARKEAVIYWHLDGDYMGESEGKHTIACAPKPGKHILTLTDTWGNQRKISFEVKQ